MVAHFAQTLLIFLFPVLLGSLFARPFGLVQLILT
jgi:hypothetical protein